MEVFLMQLFNGISVSSILLLAALGLGVIWWGFGCERLFGKAFRKYLC